MEKRREKSRCAARTRREKEAGIFTDLYETVPIVSESTITHVDRIAVLRLAATFCRVRRVAEKGISFIQLLYISYTVYTLSCIYYIRTG